MDGGGRSWNWLGCRKLSSLRCSYTSGHLLQVLCFFHLCTINCLYLGLIIIQSIFYNGITKDQLLYGLEISGVGYIDYVLPFRLIMIISSVNYYHILLSCLQRSSNVRTKFVLGLPSCTINYNLIASPDWCISGLCCR